MQPYYLRTVTSYGQRAQSQPRRRRPIGRYLVIFLAVVGSLWFLSSADSHALDNGTTVHSGITGACLDLYHDATAGGTKIQVWKCNGSAAQTWSVGLAAIKHDNDCIGAQNNGTQAGTSIVESTCTNAPGQVWLRDKTGYENPNSGLCMAVPKSSPGLQITLESCQALGQPAEIWVSYIADKVAAAPDCDRQAGGERVACFADQEWTTWQSGLSNHEALLTTYTDGAPYEEWCADFVSYVYKEAGYPFTGGQADGWDQSVAGDVQYMGFTKHSAADYIPKPGDVAYFDYPGGHVELVVSGGKEPTFVYGDSATIDPTTGNGDMRANTITHDDDGMQGQVVYYLSPNTN